MLKFNVFLALFLSLNLTLLSQIYDEEEMIAPAVNNTEAKVGSNINIYNNHMVVGTPSRREVIVFEKINSTWQQVAILTPSVLDDGKKFGYDVDIYEDVIVVGAPESSLAYVFQKPPTGWENMTETAKLSRALSPDEEFSTGWTYEFFGGSVGIYGNTIAIGSEKFDSEAYYDCGRVFLFEKPETGWENMTETSFLSVSDESQNMRLGYSMEVTEDLIIVGTEIMSANSSVYIFQKPTDGWSSATETAKLLPARTDGGFGADIAAEGDVIVVGANFAEGYSLTSGAAFVFVKPNTGWENMNETAFLSQSDALNSDNFGSSVGISGNFIIIGAPGAYDRVHDIDGGLAYLFEKSNQGWDDMTETAVLYSKSIVSFEEFGSAVAISNEEILIGADLADISGINNSGAIYRFNYIYEPQDISIDNNSIDECSAIDALIGTFTTTDGNRYDIHTYNLVDENGNGFDNEFFRIENNTLLNNWNLDYEKKNAYTVNVEVTDSSNLAYSEKFEILVNNISPIIADTVFVTTEFAPNETLIGKLNCFGDTNSIWFELDNGNYLDAFSVDSVSGEIYVNNSNALDFSNYESWTLLISANDDYYSPNANVIITTNPSTSVKENYPIDFKIYPNPTSGYFRIQSDDPSKDYALKFLNSSGQVLLERKISHNQLIDIHNMIDGLYYIKIDNQTFPIILSK